MAPPPSILPCQAGVWLDDIGDIEDTGDMEDIGDMEETGDIEVIGDMDDCGEVFMEARVDLVTSGPK